MYIYSHPRFADHEVASGHPERRERITHLLAHLEKTGFAADHQWREPAAATREAIARAHGGEHLRFISDMAPAEGVVPLDPDTWMGPSSEQAADLAAGALCNAVADVTSGLTRRVFCAVRPPGHHAERDAAMGFCIFNSVAVGALKALAETDIERVAILDFDVHHGNGTVDIFRDNRAVLVCSSFQHPHYPNRLFDIDRPNIVNSPMPAGADGKVFRAIIERDWWPALEAHQPELIFVSAGFDAHARDPLANINLVEDDFAWVTRGIVAMADQFSEGRIVSTLEGGYDLNALAASAHAHLEALAE